MTYWQKIKKQLCPLKKGDTFCIPKNNIRHCSAYYNNLRKLGYVIAVGKRKRFTGHGSYATIWQILKKVPKNLSGTIEYHPVNKTKVKVEIKYNDDYRCESCYHAVYCKHLGKIGCKDFSATLSSIGGLLTKSAEIKIKPDKKIR